MVQEGGEKPKPLTPGTEAWKLWRIQELGQARFYSWEQWKAERLRRAVEAAVDTGFEELRSELQVESAARVQLEGN